MNWTIYMLHNCFRYLLCCIWWYPYNLAHQCRMQVQGADSMVPRSSRYRSPLDCALKTVKEEGVRRSSPFANIINDVVLSWHNIFQVTGIFRGGFTTLLRESLGNAMFFSVYEYVRYYMHSRLKAASSDHSHLIDVGVGIVSGGLGGVAVCLLKTSAYFWINNVMFHLFQSLFPQPLILWILPHPSSSFGLLFCPWMWQKP